MVDAFAVFIVDRLIVLVAAGDVVADPDLRSAALFFDEIDNMEELDLSEDVRAEMLLALPMNLLCDDECAGLCPVCGADLNEEVCGCEIKEPEEKTAGENPWGALDQLNL